MATAGYLITFEGGEGGGKTTQVAQLQQRLEEIGKKVLVLREPGGTVISEQIREVVLTKKNMEMAPLTEVFLFQAARAQIYQELIIPALAEGQIVLLDRSRDSSVVYQGMVRGFGKQLIEQLNDISTQKTYPNLTFLLDVPVTMGLTRKIAAQDTNRLEGEVESFHQQAKSAYQQLAAEDRHNRWVVIDAQQPIIEVAAAIWKTTVERLQLETRAQ